MIELLTVAEVAKKLRVKKSFVYELISQKKIAVVKMSERRTRIPSDELSKYIERLKKKEMVG